MLTKQTLEVRWFNTGQIPDQIQEWFLQHCLGQLEQAKNCPEEREDYYLYVPNCEILSFKFRQEKLEIKWRKDELGVFQLSNDTGKGKIERWVKSNYPQSHFQEILDTNNFKNKTWIQVHKKRWQKLYKEVEFEISYLEIKQAFWWSIAAEMEETKENHEQHFNQVLQEFSLTYSGNHLAPKNSYAYPSWLLKNLQLN